MKEKTFKKSEIEDIFRDLHWLARRYADGRQSCATGLFNKHTRWLLKNGFALNSTFDGTVWAKDAQGRSYDGLSKEEARNGTPEARGTSK